MEQNTKSSQIKSAEDNLIMAINLGLGRTDDQFVYFDKLKGDVLGYESGYFSSYLGNQSVNNRQLANRIINREPHDLIDKERYVLFEQLRLTEFLNEFIKQTNELEPFLSFAKNYLEDLIKQFPFEENETIDDLFASNQVQEGFFKIFENKYNYKIQELVIDFTSIYSNTSRALALKWISNNVQEKPHLYRLISVNDDHFDTIINNYTSSYELTPIQINKEDYTFNKFSSIENPLFIYESSKEIEDSFLLRPEGIKPIVLADFEKMLVKSPDGIVTSYLHNNYFKKRYDNDFWYSNDLEHIEQNKKIGFKFSHCEESKLTYIDDEELYNDDFILKLDSTSLIEFHSEPTYLVIDNRTVEMYRETINGEFEKIISGTITSIYKDDCGRIDKIETISKYSQLEMLDNREYLFCYEFDTKPLEGLNRTLRNVVVTLRSRPYEIGFLNPQQWSLLFGESLGVVKLS